MAETFTDRLKLSKRDTGDLNWGQGANANLEVIDAHMQQSTLRPPRTVTATLGSGAVSANLVGNTSYFYKVTAVNAAGETTESVIPAVVEGQVVQPTTPLPIIIQWETVKGATGYRIYKSTASGQQRFLTSVSGEATASFTDDGGTASNPAVPVPATNTASLLGAAEQIVFNDAGILTGDNKLKFSKGTGILSLTGQVKLVDGLQQAGKVLTSDALGLASWQATAGGGGVTDHGALTGLSDNDHPQYQLKSVLTAKGDLYTRDATDIVRVGIGTDGQVLTADAASSAGVKWAAGGGGTVYGWKVIGDKISGAEFGEEVRFTVPSTPKQVFRVIFESVAGAIEIGLNGTYSGSSYQKTSRSYYLGQSADTWVQGYTNFFYAQGGNGYGVFVDVLLNYIHYGGASRHEYHFKTIATQQHSFQNETEQIGSVFFPTGASPELTEIRFQLPNNQRVILLKL